MMTEAQYERCKPLERKLKKLAPKAHMTYFPIEQAHQVWLDLEPISGMNQSPEQSLTEAIAVCEGTVL